MTLHWWMHWFWITSLSPYFLTTFTILGSLVESVSIPYVPDVQNGHQNGPYYTKVPPDTLGKILGLKPKDTNNYHTANYQETDQYFADEVSTTDKNIVNQQATGEAVVTPGVLILEEIPPERRSTAPTDDKTTFQPKTYLHSPFKNTSNVPVPDSDIAPNRDEKDFELTQTNDNVDIVGGYRAKSAAVHDEVVTVKNEEHELQSDQAEVGHTDEQPMNDGPFSPTGSLINSTNIRAKSNSKQISSTVRSTTTKSDFILSSDKPIGHRGKTVNREKTIEERNRAVTAVYVTPISANDSMEDGGNSSAGTTGKPLGDQSDNSTDQTVVQSAAHWDNDTDVRSLASINNGKVDVIPISKERVGEATTQQGLDAASVTGIALGILGAAGLIAGLSFVVYRRRYLNKPQVLNESNPDSIGYLDDSTLRENSEEMYSLDNDSFLNSLEAMTIQNYWTDSVKHTKL